MIFWLEIGRGRRLKKVAISIPYRTTGGAPARAPFAITDFWISFLLEGAWITQSVHDFLQQADVRLEIDTVVHFVGYTAKPHARVFNGAHQGLTRVLLNVSNEDNDFFVFNNIFKPVALGSYPSHGLKVVASNAVLDLTGIDYEGLIIEKALIAYFAPSAQQDTLTSELTRFHNLLARHSIEKITLGIEYSQEQEYFRFCGDGIGPHNRHGAIYVKTLEGIDLQRDPNISLEAVALAL